MECGLAWHPGKRFASTALKDELGFQTSNFLSIYVAPENLRPMSGYSHLIRKINKYLKQPSVIVWLNKLWCLNTQVQEVHELQNCSVHFTPVTLTISTRQEKQVRAAECNPLMLRWKVRK